MTEDFNKDGYVACVDFLDALTIKTVSKYLEYKIHRGEWKPETDVDVTAYEYYSDPLTEILLETLQPKVEQATGLSLLPTYSFCRVYVEGEELTPHIDRPSCEISVSINIAKLGKNSKIYMRSETKNDSYELNIGDAIIYKGCEVVHWRKKFEPGMLNVQIMLHYVISDGKNMEYKFDKRPYLGHPIEV